jgi:hypothetical protein
MCLEGKPYTPSTAKTKLKPYKRVDWFRQLKIQDNKEVVLDIGVLNIKSGIGY